MSGNESSSLSPKGQGHLSPSLDNVALSTKALSELSLESDRGADAAPPNGAAYGSNCEDGKALSDSDDCTIVARLRRELQRTLEEKDTLAGQYRTLLAKLTQMRTTLGNKLQQDAEELDRREQLVQQLTAEKEDLLATVDVLKDELRMNQEAARATRELELMRSRAHENMLHDQELRETQADLERCRLEREEWERIALQERTFGEEHRSMLDTLRRDLDLERGALEAKTRDIENEKAKSENLQSVLQDFQAAKDHELRQAVKDYEADFVQVTQSLAEYKHRALTAELQLEETRTVISRSRDFERENKEKNLLIGKLRHEAVILNEHLMEALRRLRRNTTDTNVDGRLVTNVILQFLTIPRADAKRFEILSLLASILSWTEEEREKAGLQRTATSVPSFWNRTPRSKNLELAKSDETESFSRMWVEFLLTEAAAGEGTSLPATPPRNNKSLPTSPGIGNHQGSPKSGTRRLASITASRVASSPNLVLGAPPPGKNSQVASEPMDS